MCQAVHVSKDVKDPFLVSHVVNLSDAASYKVDGQSDLFLYKAGRITQHRHVGGNLDLV